MRSRICSATLEAEGEHPEWVILLEPTCPLRTADDVRDCLRTHRARRLRFGGHLQGCGTESASRLASQRRSPEVFIPGAVPWLPRQKLPKAYQLNGAVYVFRAALLAEEAKSLLVGKLGAVLMPRDRSQDIDDSLDFMIV